MSLIKIDTAKQLADKNKARIAELKQLLASTDFKTLPDYQSRSGKSDAEMQVIYTQRKDWYDELQGLL